MGAESGCASWGGTGHQDTHEPSRLHDHWSLVTDQGKNYLTFVDVTEDFTIMDLENQSEGGTVLVSELHGGCCSHPQPEDCRKCWALQLERRVGRAGRLRAGVPLPTPRTFPPDVFVPLHSILLAVGRSLSTDETEWELYYTHTRRRSIVPENIVDLSLSRKLPFLQLLLRGDICKV